METNQDFSFLDDWKKAVMNYFSIRYKNQLTESQLEKVLDDIINEMYQDPICTLHNDYMTNADGKDLFLKQPLSILYKYLKTRKPILGGNGTLFSNQEKSHSPVSDLIDGRISLRNSYKEQKNKYSIDSQEHYYYANREKNTKNSVSAIYGACGMETFQLYHRYIAAAITGTVQSLISTTNNAFEKFIGDNISFKSLEECIKYMMNVKDEKYKTSLPNKNFITDKMIIFKRIKSMFECYQDNYNDFIFDFIDKLSDIELNKLYYKNNLYEFIEIPFLSDILKSIYNKSICFCDTNNIPDNIQRQLSFLWSYIRDWVMYNHPCRDRIYRLKHDKRISVKLINTDCNFVYVQPWVDFIYKKIIPYCDCKLTETEIDMISINIIAFLISQMLRETIDAYCERCNIKEEYWSRINMKNESCFSRLLIMTTKNKYIAKMFLKNGKINSQIEITGLEFKKINISKKVYYQMSSIVKNNILNVENIDTQGILKELGNLEDEMYKSLKQGEKDYLIHMNCKAIDAYKDPYQQPQILSVIAWNTLFPNEHIVVPNRFNIVFMDIPNIDTVSKLEKLDFELYENISALLLRGPSIFRSKGIRYLAIPNNIKKIPESLQPYIDYGNIVATNMATFKPIMSSLGYIDIKIGETSQFSNIRKQSVIDI